MTTGSTGSATAVAAQPAVRVERALCSRFRCSMSRCTACATVCPLPGVVRFGEQGVEISAACNGCGACASACPNGALEPAEGERQLTRRIRRQVRPGAAFRIACSRSQGSAELVLPCLARLSEAHVLEAVRGGAQCVEFLAPDCSGCELRKAAPQWQRTLQAARSLCRCAGLSEDRVQRRAVPYGQALETTQGSQVNAGRRALFRSISERWKATDGPPADTAEAPAPFRELVRKSQENPKRSGLLEVMEALRDGPARPTPVPALDVSLATLEVDGRCTGCGVCETLCPVGALSHSDTGGVYALKLQPQLCTGCGICQTACFHKAIRLRDSVDLAVLLDRRSVTLFTAPRRACRGCGEVFMDQSASEFCPSCLLSGSRRQAIAQRFFSRGEIK
ncbi:MAG: ATP-binding protein [Ramlibacter sp.]